ncbi:hypothetical protein H107_00767 [Trichophyton rubrum CBS 202.88]|nr:hypothetical protein H102_00708 [Trichophyton rubrum CBS 100081]EZF88901.1 hypothetical protein H110_00719 [Trichophyton rubrum MR1448]EZG21241.1 hypothetical protein H107_00767 [Trichophyton rubrum CBS 202.88]
MPDRDSRPAAQGQRSARLAGSTTPSGIGNTLVRAIRDAVTGFLFDGGGGGGRQTDRQTAETVAMELAEGKPRDRQPPHPPVSILYSRKDGLEMLVSPAGRCDWA